MIVYAPRIHVGGGKVLLDHLLVAQPYGPVSIVFHDERYQVPEEVRAKIKCHSMRLSFLARIKAEIDLRRTSSTRPEEQVLCFANLPPLFRLKNRAVLYLQNALLAPGIPLPKDRLKVQVRYALERIWSRLFRHHLDEIWVQTKAMRDLLIRSAITLEIDVRPLHPDYPVMPKERPASFDFVMVASRSSHKRQGDFLNAVCDLARDGVHAKVLLLTNSLTREESVSARKAKQAGARLQIEYNLDRENIFKRYAQSRCLINTSSIESFCLPLYEARAAGLDVITCDEPYAREALPRAVTFPTGDIATLRKRMSDYLRAN